MHLVQWLGIILWRWAAWVSWPLWTLRRPRGPRWWWPESRQGIHRCKLVNPEDFHVLSDLMKRLTSSGSNRYQFEFSRQNWSLWFLWNFQVNDYPGGQEISENANIINVDENRYQILVSAQNIKLKANEYVNILTLEDVSLQDNGTYICLVAKNGFTSLTFKSATVFVTSGNIIYEYGNGSNTLWEFMDFSSIPKLSPGPRIGSSFMENTTVVKNAKPKIYFSGTLRFLAENRWNALWSISICLPIEEVQNWHIFRTSFLKGFLNPYGQCNLAMIHCVWK